MSEFGPLSNPNHRSRSSEVRKLGRMLLVLAIATPAAIFGLKTTNDHITTTRLCSSIGAGEFSKKSGEEVLFVDLQTKIWDKAGNLSIDPGETQTAIEDSGIDIGRDGAMLCTDVSDGIAGTFRDHFLTGLHVHVYPLDDGKTA